MRACHETCRYMQLLLCSVRGRYRLIRAQPDSWAATAPWSSWTHLQADSGAALLDSFHGVLHLVQASLRAPCGHVCVVLQCTLRQQVDCKMGGTHCWPSRLCFSADRPPEPLMDTAAGRS